MSQPAETDVLILCGGPGKRLRPLTDDIPKSMVRIGDTPFLEILLNQVAAHGFKRVILCTGYKEEVIRSYFKAYHALELVFSHETSPLGTGGGLKLAENHVRSSTFLTMNGDSYCDVHLKELLAYHTQQNALATLSVSEPDPERRDTGSLVINDKMQVESFTEKSGAEKRSVNAGVYAFDKKIFEFIERGKSVSLENEIFPRLDREKFYAFKTGAKLYDIGTPERLEKFRNDYLKTGQSL